MSRATTPRGAADAVPDMLLRSDEAAPELVAGTEPTGAFTLLDGETCYRISAYHRMRPFLMTIASDTDFWIFLASGGGLTAGRRDPDGAVFPYETVDKLHDAHHHTGPITLLRTQRGGEPTALWQPFAETAEDDAAVERRLYKNLAGNRVVFEEIRRDLGLRFRYRWSSSDDLGLVRTATLENLGSDVAVVALLDGVRNVLPHGAPLPLLQHASCLVDAYKRAEYDPATRLGIYSLTAKITDRPEAAEELRATTVWSYGLDQPVVALSLDAVAAFRRGEPVSGEALLTGRRGNYLLSSSLALEPGTAATWHVVADTGRSHVQIAALRARLLEDADPGRWIETSLAEATENLVRNVASADGLQCSADAEATAHHFACVLFNNMRGGVFAKNHDVPVADWLDFIRTRDRAAWSRSAEALRSLPAEIPVPDLLHAVEQRDDPDLRRLAYEYLPLFFARRHGDPSRPWNRFSIHVKNRDGTRALHYQGNWRDIFQNWEALCLSFPQFLPGIVAKFVNASTVDGFNPYRITRDGVDWEVPDPKAPWSHIGYWGDHQVVYLLRLLEATSRFLPGTLERLLDRSIFCHADVPYRLKSYDEIVADPRASIVFDFALASRIEERVRELGTDGRLVRGTDGSVRHVTLLEKLLIPALSKISNLVPGGGIWMNTQRPEWNDANNALAGYGLSMVTLYHLRRYVRFLDRLAASRARGSASISTEVAVWLRRLHAVLREHRAALAVPTWTDRERRRMMDALGAAFSDYRDAVYAGDAAATREEVPEEELAAFFHCVIEHLDHTIRAGRREDGLYHSYHLLEIDRDRSEARVQPLEVMLEGQVAALASGVVGAPEAVRLLERLFDSPLYRPDQKSFLLYPAKDLPGFLDRNRVSDEAALAVPLLRELLDAGEPSILERDAFGVCRFHGDLRHVDDLSAALDRLASCDRWSAAVARDRGAVLDVFEGVFQHHAFTGRSGAMYAYEGLGSVYWHMVAKLLLAVQEIALDAPRDREPAPVQEALRAMYLRIRAGFGFEKTAAEHGAFPTDPYSHTPAHAGAQQPGMTGQVKEMILARFGELGVTVEEGFVGFRPWLLRRREFLAEGAAHRFYDIGGTPRTIALPAGSLAFTLCQVPVVYQLTSSEAWIRVTATDGTSNTRRGSRLDERESRSILARDGGIARIDVAVPEQTLFDR